MRPLTPWSDEELLAACDREQLRRSGPGGQRRNKVETGVRLRHRPTGLIAEAFESRSAPTNLRHALDRLRRKLALEVRRPPSPTPSPLWQSRCRGGRLAVNPRHVDFPALLAELLDVLAVLEWQLPAAAERLGVTSSQLVKLLTLEPRALALVNRQRQASGLPPLKR